MLLGLLELLPDCPLWIPPYDRTTTFQTVLLRLPLGTVLLWLWVAPSIELATPVETSAWQSKPHNPMNQRHLNRLQSLANIASNPKLLTDHSISPQTKTTMWCLLAWFRWMWWVGREPTFCRVCRRCRNGLPGRTTFVACCSKPVRLWRACLDRHLFETAAASSSFRQRSLSLVA